MKNIYKISTGLFSFILAFSFFQSLDAQVFIPQQQAFKKGCLLLSISEGSTTAGFSTSNSKTTESHSPTMDGVRDPLFIEFGLSNRLGIGVSSGNDIFQVNPTTNYGFTQADKKDVTVKTSEFTFDFNYHIYTRAKTDVSLYTSVGSFGVAFTGKNGDYNYNYNAKGGIIRMGTKVRYYFYRRLGVLGMLSYYSASATPVKGNNTTSGSDITTSIKGYALEFGLCFRFF